MAKTSRAKTLTYIEERIAQIKGVFGGNPEPDLIEHLNIEMEVLHAAKSALGQLDKVPPVTPLPQRYVIRMGRHGQSTELAPVLIPDDKGEWINRFDVERLITQLGGRYE